MTRNEHAVSPVIGVMLMIVVAIIIAAVVSAFAAGTDMTKRTGPLAALSSEIRYSTVPQEVSVSWDTETFVPGHAAVDCNNIPSSGDDNSEFCASLMGTFDLEGVTTSQCSSEATIYYGGPYDGCIYAGGEDTIVTTPYNSDTYLANKDGLLFTSNGGDAIDLKDLEMTVRYYNLASTVYYSDVKSFAPSTIPTGAVNVAGSVEEYESLGTRYFVKVNATSTEDTIIRPGDQFMFLVDHLDKHNQFDPTHWALSSTRSDGNAGASIGIDTRTGQMEWWLTHSPSGNTLAHGKFEIPNT